MVKAAISLDLPRFYRFWWVRCAAPKRLKPPRFPSGGFAAQHLCNVTA
jgi:hypothetical protein